MSSSIPSSSAAPVPISISTTTIFDLPETLLLHILSFLYIQDAVLTSLVSRKFRNLWHSMSSLKFDMAEYYSRSREPIPRNHVARQEFAQFVYHTLFVRKPYPCNKFVLIFEYIQFENEAIPKYEYYVQNWIRYAIGLSVSELTLEFNHDKFDSWEIDTSYRDDEDENENEKWFFIHFDFHFLDIRESCIKVLKLLNCHIQLPQKSSLVKFLYLKSLEIGCVSRLSDEDVCDLLARCVNLETLKFINVEFYPYGGCGLAIYSASLKELYLHFTCCQIPPSHLDIRCPSLQKISLIDSEYGKYTLKDTTLLVEACVDFLFLDEDYNRSWEKMLCCFTNISSLRVWDELLESNGVPAGCELFASNVKHLELYCAFNENDLLGLAALLKLFPKLEILGLHNRDTKKPYNRSAEDAKLHKDYWQASTVFNMPCLRKVILRKYQNSIGERHFIKLFRKNGVVLEKIELLHFSNRETEDH